MPRESLTDGGPLSSAGARSLALVQLVAREGRPIALVDLASRLGLPKATTHRLCEQLVEGGWLSRDSGDRLFAVGPSLQRLAYDALNHGTTRGLRHAVLEALVAKIGETCNFTTLDGTRVLYLDRVEAPWPVRLTLDVGSHVPLHCTASGKLFLAHLDDATREQVLAGLALPRMTATTIVGAAALRDECARIAEVGWSCDREEFVGGLIAVAVPVRDDAGEVRAAIAVHAPTARMDLDAALARLPALQAAAKKMAALL